MAAQGGPRQGQAGDREDDDSLGDGGGAGQAVGGRGRVRQWRLARTPGRGGRRLAGAPGRGGRWWVWRE
jgi:hypothetical protein